MRRVVTFPSQGEAWAGWLYLPDDVPAATKVPAIVTDLYVREPWVTQSAGASITWFDEAVKGT